MKKWALISFLTLPLLILNVCSPRTSEVVVLIDNPPFEKLSDYHFFRGKLSNLIPNNRVLPYDLNSSLFTDYAKKSRFVWMPKDSNAQYQNLEVLEFPIGSVLIKNFYYDLDETSLNSERKIIETRLLIHRKEEWEAHTYVWNKQQTEATLDLVGDIIPVDWISPAGKRMHVNYIIPNKNQCLGCHSKKNILTPIGPKIRNLNKDFVYPDGIENQLNKWVSHDYLKGLDVSIEHPVTAQWQKPYSGSLHLRAMAYLDINCGHCHNPDGPGGTSGLNLVYDAPLDLNLGIYKPPVASGRASGGHSYSIVPGHPELSIMSYRMKSSEPGVMMPELGRTLTHYEGVKLINDWIASLEGSDKIN